MNRFIRNTGFYLILFLVVVGIVQFISNGGEATDNPDMISCGSDQSQQCL